MCNNYNIICKMNTFDITMQALSNNVDSKLLNIDRWGQYLTPKKGLKFNIEIC